MLSTMSRSRWVPTRRTSWPLSVSGHESAVAMIPDPNTVTLVNLVLPLLCRNGPRGAFANRPPYDLPAYRCLRVPGLRSCNPYSLHLHRRLVAARLVPDGLVHQVLHRRVRLHVAVHVELIRLVRLLVRFDGVLYVHHVIGGGLYVGVDAGADGSQHRRAQDRAFGHPRQGD